MLKIGICDDNATLLNKYQKMVSAISEAEQWDVNCYTFTDGEDVLNAFMKDRECLDILFLDILMKKLNGVDAAKKIRRINGKLIIIFLTSSEEYIFESIGLNAMGYILKDQLIEKTFIQILMKAVRQANECKQDVIQFHKSGCTYKLSYDDICFVKVYKGYCYIHHFDGIIYESSDMSLIDLLKHNGFYQVHDQYIVSLQYIGKIEKNCIVLSDESKNEIPIHKKFAKDLKITFANYMIQKAKGNYDSEHA